MTSPVDTSKNIETWEVAGEGTAWVWVKDPREGKFVKQRVGGRAGGSRKLHISTDDRRFNEEQVIEEMEEHNVFRNGTLRFISASERQEDDITTANQLTEEDMEGLLAIKDEDLFRDEIQALKSELVVRRLKALAEKQGTLLQNEIINDVIEARWKVGGTQKTVRELIEAGERIGGTVLSDG